MNAEFSLKVAKREEMLLEFRYLRSVEWCLFGRARKMLKNEPTLAIGGVDTAGDGFAGILVPAENKNYKVWAHRQGWHVAPSSPRLSRPFISYLSHGYYFRIIFLIVVISEPF